MEKPRCPCSAETRYLTHLPPFRESRFFKVFQKWQRRALTHIPFVTQSTLIRAAAVFVLVLTSPTTVWLRVFLSNSHKVGKFHPRVASVNLPSLTDVDFLRRTSAYDDLRRISSRYSEEPGGVGNYLIVRLADNVAEFVGDDVSTLAHDEPPIALIAVFQVTEVGIRKRIIHRLQKFKLLLTLVNELVQVNLHALPVLIPLHFVRHFRTVRSVRFFCLHRFVF